MKLELAPGLFLCVALVAGCTTVGAGSGSTVAGEDPVTFTWKSTGPSSGTMTAMLQDGSAYSGRFFQITDETTVDRIDQVPFGWFSRWPETANWNGAPEADLLTHLSDSVVANLGGADGKHLRCSFELASPREGMAGGGVGQCRMPDGSTIDATFPTG
jgi:hypothetical protein